MNPLVYWIALSQVRGVGPVLFKRLTARFGSPDKVFEATESEIREVEGVGEAVAGEVLSYKDWKRAEDEMMKAVDFGSSIITMADESYPALLREIYDPPPFLYVKGNLKKEDKVIAIVGSRFATAYGKSVTDSLSRELARSGFTVSSGMARGIDSEAHRGALEAGGRTVAVLGSGIDVVYPRENRKLYDRIIEQGAVVSELPMGVGPLSENFPARNRIISGMSKGVVVVEASIKSGSLITASCAMDQGRDVFSVPGNVTSKGSRGTNFLIKHGAKLVEEALDILEEYHCAGSGKVQGIALSEKDEAILDLLTDPGNIDEIAQRAGMDVRTASAVLLDMELRGVVRQLPGMIYAKNI